MSKALVLFDIDGCTSIVETKKLQCDGAPTQGVVATISHGGEQLRVEILKLSDVKRVLNRHEDIWSQGERASALDLYKQREATEGGFLMIGPPTLQDDDVDQQDAEHDQAVEEQQVPEHHELLVAEPVVETREIGQEMTRDNSRGEILGLKNRKVVVCHEGSGDYSRQHANPKRQPFFTENLNPDQIELLYLQVAEYQHDKRTIGVQTEPVIVVDSVLELLQSFQCGKCPALERKLDAVLESVQELKQAVEKNESSLSESFFNNLVSHGTPVMTVVQKGTGIEERMEVNETNYTDEAESVRCTK